MFTDWGGRKVSEYWGNVFRCGKSGFTVNRGAVNRGFTVVRFSDSLYLAISADQIDKVIKPDLWDEWLKVKKLWFPKTDTPEVKAYDKRTPGIEK